MKIVKTSRREMLKSISKGLGGMALIPSNFLHLAFAEAAQSLLAGSQTHAGMTEWIVGPYVQISPSYNMNSYSLAYFNLQTGENGRVPIPFRGHGVLKHPNHSRAVLVMEKGGDKCAEIDLVKRKVSKIIKADEHSIFYGHGCFSSDGSKLYTSEHNKETRHGSIRIRNGKTYEPIGEISSYGFQPHDMMLIDEGQTVVIANHGKSYRRGDQVGEQKTCVAFIDLKSGHLIKKLTAEGHGFELSHLFLSPEGQLIVGSLHPPGSKVDGNCAVFVAEKDSLQKLPLPPDIQNRLKDQCFGMAIHKESGTLAVTCAKSNVAVFWNYREKIFLKSLESLEPYGIVVSGDRKYFLISTLTGVPVWVRTSDLEVETGPHRKLLISNSSHMIDIEFPTRST